MCPDHAKARRKMVTLGFGDEEVKCCAYCDKKLEDGQALLNTLEQVPHSHYAALPSISYNTPSHSTYLSYTIYYSPANKFMLRNARRLATFTSMCR